MRLGKIGASVRGRHRPYGQGVAQKKLFLSGCKRRMTDAAVVRCARAAQLSAYSEAEREAIAQ
jgi:hypothetical protein